MLPLSGCFVGQTAYDAANAQDIVKLGGEFCITFSNDVTHLVVTNDHCPNDTLVRANASGVFVVKREWVVDCMSNYCRMTESNYIFNPNDAQLESSSDAETLLPGWVPFKTNRKVKVRTIKMNVSQPVNYAKEFTILGQVVLQLSNLGKNNNKYYALELHQDTKKSNSQFRVFCHYGRTCDLEKNPQAGQKCYRYFSNENDAKTCFQNLYDEKTKKGYIPLELTTSNIGSERVKELRLRVLSSKRVDNTPSSFSSEDSPESSLHPEVQRLVEDLYAEASKAITASVNAKITPHGIETALGVLSKNQVAAGEKILLQIKSILERNPNQKNKITELSSQFYSLVPHNFKKTGGALKDNILDSMHKLEQKMELLQLMSDMLDLISAGGVGNVVDMQYKALNVDIVPLYDRNSYMFQSAAKYILGSQTTPNSNIAIKNLFAIRRPQEKLYTAVGNVQLQFHGSRACNFVGLLSRGLLMPKIVVSRGGGRTDAGLLGNGIYFSDSVSTAAQYAYPNSKGSRFVLANRVALGRVKDYITTQIGLEKPPFGYSSVHGVSKANNPQSVFKDEEFVVFETNQQSQEYLIEFEFLESQQPVISSPIPQPLTREFFESQGKNQSSISQVKPYESPFNTEFESSSTGFNLNPPTQFSFGESSDSQFSSSSLTDSYSAIEHPPQPSQFSFTDPIPASQFISSSSLIDTEPTSVSYSSQLNNDDDNIQNEEEKYRKLFAKDPNNPSIRDPYVNLIDIMNNSPSFQYQLPTNEESKNTAILTKFSNFNARGPSVCASLNKFKENWEAFTSGQFTGIDWNNLFVAGGSVLACLQPDFSTSIEPSNPYHSSDIDIFVYGLNTFQATQKLKEVCNVLARNSGNSTFLRSKHAITFLGQYPYRHTQIILRIYKSPAEILMGFDIDCCGVGFDGERIYAIPRARRAINKQFNLVDLSRRSLTYETRLHKYSTRGFAVRVPGLDLSRINSNLYQRSVGEVKGLAKLLILNNIQSTGLVCSRKRTKGAPSSSINQRTDESDYSNVSLPWGPNWIIPLLINTINKQNHILANTPNTTDHIFISDLNGVLSGKDSSNCQCSVCTSGQVPPYNPDVSGPLKWVTENPGRQILTGSFHPVTDDQWYSDAYAYWSEIPGASFRKARQPKTDVTKKQVFSKPPAVKSVGISPTTSSSLLQKASKPLKRITPTQVSRPPLFPPKSSTPIAPHSGMPSVEIIQPKSDTSKLLLLISKMAREGLITNDEKATIKDLTLQRNSAVISALEVFEIDHDLEELADSLQRICKFSG